MEHNFVKSKNNFEEDDYDPERLREGSAKL